MPQDQINLRDVVKDAVAPFAFSPHDRALYLADLNGLPIYDLILHFQEVMLIVTDEGFGTSLSISEISRLRTFAEQVSALPPESDSFWEDVDKDARWEEIRYSAGRLVELLS